VAEVLYETGKFAYEVCSKEGAPAVKLMSKDQLEKVTKEHKAFAKWLQTNQQVSKKAYQDGEAMCNALPKEWKSQ